MYAQTFSVNGGAAPYHWQLNGTLPAGLAFADGQLSGTPQSSGNSAFSVRVRCDRKTLQAGYTLMIAAAAPVATDHSASLAAGQSVAVSLTGGATGGPFTGAQLRSSRSAAWYSHDTCLRSRLSVAVHRGGAGQRNRHAPLCADRAVRLYPACPVLLTITERPNPARDADVIGMISAQYQAAQNFARAQLRNFSDRLEQLHSGANLPSDMSGIRFSMPSTRPGHDTDQKMLVTGWQQQKSLMNNSAGPSAIPSIPFSTEKQAQRLSYWTGDMLILAVTRPTASASATPPWAYPPEPITGFHPALRPEWGLASDATSAISGTAAPERMAGHSASPCTAAIIPMHFRRRAAGARHGGF